MAEIKHFKLPDVGEGLTEGEILQWLVAVGDTVKVNQPIVEVETAKAAVELPCPYAGVVTELMYDAGVTVDVGQPIIAIDTQPGDPAEPTPLPPSQETLDQIEVAGPEEPVESGLIGGPAPGGRTAVLVGYGPKTTEATRRPRRAGSSGSPAVQAARTAAGTALRAAAVDPTRGNAVAVSPAELPTVPSPGTVADLAEVPAEAPPPTAEQITAGRAKAKPPVRKYARDLGVDLSAVQGSGPQGSITREDVDLAAQGDRAAQRPGEPVERSTGAGPAYGSSLSLTVDPSFDSNRERRIPIKGVRRHTAAAMVASAFTAPHVTEWITVDVTPVMRLRDRLGESRAFRGVKLSPLALVARALLLAARRHPMINSSWDEAAQEIVVKGYVNLGIAAATPRGLIVPNIKDAGALDLHGLADALTRLTETARAGKTAPADMSGGTITITNVGVFGVDTGTPILNPGESAILAFGAVREQPWVHKGKVKPRLVTTLGLSFDHRVIDGELGSRFLADVAAVLADPGVALAW